MDEQKARQGEIAELIVKKKSVLSKINCALKKSSIRINRLKRF